MRTTGRHLKGVRHVRCTSRRTPFASAIARSSAPDVNVRAAVDEHGVGGQTPIYHAVTQFNDFGLSVTRALRQAGADLSIRARLPGSYENPDEVVDCTPHEYAQRFPGAAFPGSNRRSLLVDFLAARNNGGRRLRAGRQIPPRCALQIGQTAARSTFLWPGSAQGLARVL